MRIVNVADIFQPEGGYLKHVLGKYLIELGHEFIILTTDLVKPDGFSKNWDFDSLDNEYTENTGVPIIRIHCDEYISGRALWKFKTYIEKLREIKPDIIYVNGNDSYIGILSTLFIKKLPGTLVMDSHMLEMASANRFKSVFRLFYKLFVTPIIKRNGIIVIRAQDDPFVERAFGIPLELAPYVSLGSDVELFYPDEEERKDFRNELGIDDDAFVVTYAGKLDKNKSGQLLADVFLDKFGTDRQMILIAVGNTTGEYGRSVEDTFCKSKNRIIRYPTQKYRDLPRFYQVADLVVFSKECSLSFFDAEACGTPVLSEDNNINVERCSHENGWNFKAGDLLDYKRMITMIANLPEGSIKKYRVNSRNYVLHYFNYKLIAKQYEEFFHTAIERNKEGAYKND